MRTLRGWSRLCPISMIRKLRLTRDIDSHPLSHPTGPFTKTTTFSADEFFLHNYMLAHHRASQLHERFWYRNNVRFAHKLQTLSKFKTGHNSTKTTIEIEEELAVFYRTYLQENQCEFRRYHQEAWRMSLMMVFLEYRWLMYRAGRWFQTLFLTQRSSSSSSVGVRQPLPNAL